MDESQKISPSEWMIVAASRALQDSRTVFVGVGLPNIACNLARRTHSLRKRCLWGTAGPPATFHR